MTPKQLARMFLDIFYSGKELENLYTIFSEDLEFCGPFAHTQTAKEYIQLLKQDPPKNMSYKIIKEYRDINSVCIVYEFTKDKITTPMVQIFEVTDSKISKIKLIFNAKDFEHF